MKRPKVKMHNMGASGPRQKSLQPRFTRDSGGSGIVAVV